MTVSVKVGGTSSMDGKTYAQNRTLTAEGVVSKRPSKAAAKTGALTTRTDNDTGTLTMDAGHGITTGAKLDMYWANADGTRGVRRNVTVGTVAVNSVPIDLGSGDNLPIAPTAITAMVPTASDFRFDGDELVALMASCAEPCVIVLTGDDDVEDLAIVMPYGGMSYIWDKQSGITNPVAGDVITKAWITHGSSVGIKDVQIGAALSI
jgi:hypothetical protein